MSLINVNRSTIIKEQIHHNAEANSYYLIGRIVSVSKLNSKNVSGEDESSQDTVTLVPMTVDGIVNAAGVELINKTPLTIKVLKGWVADIPTGYKYPKVNKERKIEVVGPIEITHGASTKNKNLDKFFNL